MKSWATRLLLHSRFSVLGSPFFICLLWLGLSLSRTRADAAGTPRFEVTTAAGLTHSGTLDKLTEDWSLRLLDRDTPIPVKGADVVSLRRSDTRLPRQP